jgi:hypothetical protein
MYGNGLGVPKDYAEAIKWFRLAAEQGNAGAQSMLDKVLAEIEDQKRKDKDYKDLMESSDKRAEELGISKEVLEAITKRINKAIDEAINPRWDPNDLLKLAPFGECMNCNLQGANLERADLRGANLENANLDGASLAGANLDGANLQGASMKGARMKSAILCNTTMPDGSVIYSGC